MKTIVFALLFRTLLTVNEKNTKKKMIPQQQKTAYYQSKSISMTCSLSLYLSSLLLLVFSKNFSSLIKKKLFFIFFFLFSFRSFSKPFITLRCKISNAFIIYGRMHRKKRCEYTKIPYLFLLLRVMHTVTKSCAGANHCCTI